jgi:hypothetical protein
VGEESFETEVSVAAGSAAASRRLDLGQRRGHLLALGTSLLSLVSLAAANDLNDTKLATSVFCVSTATLHSAQVPVLLSQFVFRPCMVPQGYDVMRACSQNLVCRAAHRRIA